MVGYASAPMFVRVCSIALLLSHVAGCGSAGAESEASTTDQPPSAEGSAAAVDLEASEASLDESEERARQARIDREYPLHGVVTAIRITVRKEPDPEGRVAGWLNLGNRIRLKKGPAARTETCSSGWYELMPRGYACAGEGIEIGDEPPSFDIVLDEPEEGDPLPFSYWLVKETLVPQYHGLPSRDQQRAALAYAEKYAELLEKDERRATRYLETEQAHAAVARFLHRQFYVAGTGVETRSRRNFVRTMSGGYVKAAQLERYHGSDFRGVELDEETSLPIAYAIRAIRPLIKRDKADGSIRWIDDDDVDAIERHTRIEGWKDRQNIGGSYMHIMDGPWEGERYARDWFVTVIEKIAPPFEVAEEEPWIHVDLSSQSLVIYRGEKPVYATLVSTGLEGHDTPTGTFEIEKKMLSDTMANIGPDAGDDRYRIEDVPYTQYFDGSVALHTAFWHNRFGLQRSHGCVNIAPHDAKRVFQETWPRIPEGWHGVSTDQTGFRASRVHVTE